MNELTTTSCGRCGVRFCLPTTYFHLRKRDGEPFHCPNGHELSFKPTEDEKRIAELEEQVRQWKEAHRWLEELNDERLATIEELVGAIKACPYGCGWRSRRQIPRDPVSMGRGLERVEASVREHLQEVHGARPTPQRLLEERTA
jgi:hypothetical protein